MRTMSVLRAAGGTDPGHYREVNEDRFHVDVQRGLFLVVDGVGGQAAGGKAADTAVTTIRARLEQETGPVVNRVREAIAAANNEIHRLASLRAEWAGMACVLTAAVVDQERAVIGHVGDTRLYKIRNGCIAKITRDHSPVGEREDAGEISELDAMRHPRRHHVYRDVGSEVHAAVDPDFIDVVEIPFEADAALLICSDGLTDLVSSYSIHEIVSKLAGEPDVVVQALVAAANEAGGKDNVTVVYVEGERFAPDSTRPLPSRFARDERLSGGERTEDGSEVMHRPSPPQSDRRWVRFATVVGLATVLVAAAAQRHDRWPALDALASTAEGIGGVIVVRSSDSIMVAVNRAASGASIVVEPGEYRECIRLKNGVRLISAEPRGATIRLPSDASEQDPAVVADGVSDAEMTGFRIVGDAATPLGTGLSIRNASVSIVDVEISGAAQAAIDIAGLSGGTILGADAHDNPGAALRVGTGTTTRIAHSSFIGNGSAAGHAASLLVETGANPRFSRNTFQGIAPSAFVTLDGAARARVARDNWFIEQAAPGDTLRRNGRNR
jgi:serine/threonine protein phosphatase PrpC